SSPPYSRSALIAGAVRIRYRLSPSFTPSSTPATVTACGTLQLELLNTSDVVESDPSPSTLGDKSIRTGAVGRRVRTTVNLAAPPDSVVASPPVGLTVMPGAGTSVTWIVTAAVSEPPAPSLTE